MTADKAFYAWTNSFIPSYPSTSVPDDVAYPYAVYEWYESSFGDGDINVAWDLYDYTDGEAEINATARNISKEIGHDGVMLKVDNGRLWIKRASPFMQAISDETDLTVKRRRLLINIEFLTQY